MNSKYVLCARPTLVVLSVQIIGNRPDNLHFTEREIETVGARVPGPSSRVEFRPMLVWFPACKQADGFRDA